MDAQQAFEDKSSSIQSKTDTDDDKNAKISMEIVLNETPPEQQSSSSDLNVGHVPVENVSISNDHPYKDILLNLEPTSDQLTLLSNIEPCKPLQETPLHEIYSLEDLQTFIEGVKQEKELGMDVEYSDRGYEAVTCLIQISTKENDYIIDAIKLKEHLHLLTKILLNPNIVKIFHAASNDLKWLQQDLHLFVINMFDTQRAMKALNHEKLGLDRLLTEYKVKKDKSFQRSADFRKRPIPPEYKEYARTDSHFLIHIYYTLRNELIKANLLHHVLEECKKDCLVVYGEQQDTTYLSVRNSVIAKQQRQLVALEKLNQWRHRIAKETDKSTGRVLSRDNMKELILQLPVDAASIIRIGKSNDVRQHVQEIAKIMIDANSDRPQSDTSEGSSYKRRADEDIDGTIIPFKRMRNFNDNEGYTGRNTKYFRQYRGNRRRRFYR